MRIPLHSAKKRRRQVLTTSFLLAGTGSLSACSAATQPPATSAPGSGTVAQALDQPITHIHGVARDPATDRVVIATHEGAFERRDGAWYALGDVIDLMGFAIAPDGTWFASGHPGIETDLPEPVGLIASTDRGQTWQVISRGGESDFHALAAGPAGVLGFDGTLRASADGVRWEEVSIPAPPFALSVEETSGAVLATTEHGLVQSTDDAATWTALEPPELVALVDWVDEDRIVGATVEGRVVTSEDSGRSWKAGPALPEQVQAMSAQPLPTGEMEILIATHEGVLSSLDGGATFTALP